MMAPPALIVVGVLLIVLAILAGASDLIKLALIGMGVLSIAFAGILEVVGRRTAR
jgi:hypothetical protein